MFKQIKAVLKKLVIKMKKIYHIFFYFYIPLRYHIILYNNKFFRKKYKFLNNQLFSFSK